MRQPGTKNREKEISEVIGKDIDNEDKFLAELIAGKARWARIANELQKEGKPNEREKEYSEAYKVLINKFSEIEPPEKAS